MDFCPDIKTGQPYVEAGEQYHMNDITIADKVESESDNESIITTFQYLKINNNKAVKSGKLSNYSVLLDTGSTYSVFNYKNMIVNIQKSDK